MKMTVQAVTLSCFKFRLCIVIFQEMTPPDHFNAGHTKEGDRLS